MKKISAKTFNIIRIVILCAAAVALIYASYSLTDSYLGYKEDELEKAVAEYGEGYLCQGATGIAVERYVESLVVLTE